MLNEKITKEHKRHMVKTVCLRASRAFYYIVDSTIKSIDYKRNMCYGICYARNNL
jgi:hypothetical protein